jgi:hypothetical protein
MKALGSMGNDEDLELELCPVCKVNYIGPNEDMCAVCAKEKSLAEDEEKDPENTWDNYTAPEEDDAGYSEEESSDMVSITNLDDGTIETDDEILPLADEDADEDADSKDKDGKPKHKDEEEDPDDEEDVDDYCDDDDEDDEDDKKKHSEKKGKKHDDEDDEDDDEEEMDDEDDEDEEIDDDDEDDDYYEGKKKKRKKD